MEVEICQVHPLYLKESQNCSEEASLLHGSTSSIISDVGNKKITESLHFVNYLNFQATIFDKSIEKFEVCAFPFDVSPDEFCLRPSKVLHDFQKVLNSTILSEKEFMIIHSEYLELKAIVSDVSNNKS